MTSDSEPLRARAIVAGICVGAVSVLWFVLLSGWIGVVPGTPLVKRQNVLFNSDTNSWIDEVVRDHEPAARAVHPLEVSLSRLPCRALRVAFGVVLPPERAELLAARVFVATIVGAGVGCLAYVSTLCEVAPLECILLFSMYLCFSSSVIAALPEHFGISCGLLSMTFATPFIITSARVRTASFAILAVLAGGTTITNVVYPLASWYRYGIAAARTRRLALVAAVIGLSVAALLLVDSQRANITGRSVLSPRVPGIGTLYLKTARIHIHILDYLNLRLVVHPANAVVYAVYAVVAPVVAPLPVVRVNKGHQMVTYESGQPLRWTAFGVTGYDGLRLRDYRGLPAAGAMIWILLLARCTSEALRDRNARQLAWLPLGWIAFNLLLHNVWGDELFLYTPHWSWALFALVILGASRLSRLEVATLVVPLIACQVYALLQFKTALALINQ